MRSRITDGIVRILTRDAQTAGTGFVVSDDGLIVTCAHIVSEAGAKPGDTVDFIFHTLKERAIATVEPAYWSDPTTEDVAILRMQGPLP